LPFVVNVANEWSDDDWLAGYEAAIAEMRNAGIRHTLVIDANGWRQTRDDRSDWGGTALTDWGRSVIEGANGIGATSQKASTFLLGT
jgi:hypothetical protein